ncbi:hypothetical protein GGI25_003194 [Coemansia spiralis]|uniref:PABS domain-containing protein n=2 Tax=Coemansia TaxID=4863 RepID=A0A9W8KWR8_9FUNG|nr:hypothetical protein EDC05_003188 [Coemansia umbellata]KAJ2621884.1 hypothetical protein GGI26_003727 [Coemansia sp. RSA 1358]KAJ2677439.1 hypothetical protein GGI25_003194 [Coemansia spiralis]
MSSTAPRRRKPASAAAVSSPSPPTASSKEHNTRSNDASARKSTVFADPPTPILISIFISFMSTAILVSSLIRLGPQYLEPVYGNVLPYVGFFHATLVSLVVGGIAGSVYWRHILAVADPTTKPSDDPLTVDTRTGRAISMAFDIAAIITALSPLRAAYVFRWSGRLGPVWGSLISHCVLVLPVFALGGLVTVLGAARVSYNPHSPTRQTVMLAAYLGAAALTIWIGQQFSTPHRGCHGLLINAGYAALSSLIIKLLVGHQENVDVVNAIDSLSANPDQKNQEQNPQQSIVRLRERQLRKLRFVPVVAAVFFGVTTLFSDPRCTNGLTSKNNQDTSKYTMLLRAESVTGWVTVSDESKRQMRLLRSGHSIIGGHWNATEESIFGIFYYADAVRLVKGRKNSPEAKSKGNTQPRRLAKDALIGDGTERALQIGLGIGVSARSLHEQNVRVDVVEIDPAVYQAATDYFTLPKNLNSVHLMDGRKFINEAQTGIYDYVIHDVFTGGSVPASLFSQSAMSQLRRILKPDGVLAMNYVGVPSDTRTLAHVTYTLRTSFPYIRCFAETSEDMDSMVNMMFFASSRPLNFDITSDVLKAMGMSTIRARMLQEMEKNEIDVDRAVKDTIGVQPITDEWNPLPEWQIGPAIKHWEAMRSLFPEEYWLNY